MLKFFRYFFVLTFMTFEYLVLGILLCILTLKYSKADDKVIPVIDTVNVEKQLNEKDKEDLNDMKRLQEQQLNYFNEAAFKFGLGVFNSAKNSPSEVKQVSLSYEQRLLNNHLIDQYELGFWEDSRRDMGRKDSGFGSFSLGVPIDFPYFFIQGMYGVAFITSPDSYLGGVFPQFKGDFIVGAKDSKGNSIGLDFSHISSGGIYKINEGRDVISLRIAIPFDF